MVTKEFIQTVILSNIDGAPEEAETAIHQHFSPKFVQTGASGTYDFEGLIKHTTYVRNATVTGKSTVDVKTFLQEGTKVAWRHEIDLKMKDGTSGTYDVLAIGELDAEDKFINLHLNAAKVGGDGEDLRNKTT